MPSVSEILKSKTESKQQRIENNRAEREKLSASRSDALMAVTQMPELYEKFLVLQADNIGCSAGNVALSLFQMNEATKIGTAAYWHEQGRYVIDSEMQKGAKVFVPPRDPKYRGYLMGDYYDVSHPKSVKKLEKLFIAPQARRILHETARRAPRGVSVRSTRTFQLKHLIEK